MKAIAAFVLGLFASALHAQSPDLGGVKVASADPSSEAAITAVLAAPFKLQISVAPHAEARPQTIRIDLPNSGPKAWPAADVEVRDASGKALLVRRSGIEWFKLLVPLPAGVTSCVVEAVPPPGGWVKPTPEKSRAIEDPTSGVKMRIAKWHDGRDAALSIRFDDSHPTHLSKAAPILESYGFRGTFMINPGASEPGSRRVSEFNQQRAAWEALAKQGKHEFANHSAHHRGGLGDADMEAEIGEAAQVIWQMTPGKSRLTALNLGGGTRWETTRSLRYYLDKYHHFDASENSTGMDDSYGNRVENFRRILQQHLQRGLWCRIHYHYIGEGLSSSEANFRAAMDIAKEHEAKLWIAGMADIHQYMTERDAAKLALIKADAQQLSFKLTCATDAALYDQPLTIEMVLPPAWKLPNVSIKDAKGSVIPTMPGKLEGADALRFDVPPREAEYLISVNP
ncbi:polysaccharide deacetylase family protein [Prosthecobacter sp.]|uniref:polysaccharide deacetylase family protein n=1 Tax=Prosthecobacter sp. TaxID=1965333 RepID=UPI00378523AF